MRITSTQKLAIKGSIAAKARHEAFVGGDMTGDKMVLIYASQQKQRVSARRMATLTTTRIVQLERKWTPDGGDFWWQARTQTVLTTSNR